MSPDMPVTKVISPSHQRTSTSNSLGLCKLNNVVNGDITNGDCSLVINGHLKSSEDRYPTGDKKVDGEYFLGLTRLEENRILSQCRQIDPDINCPDLPEEAHGKIRATIGKANLLINQKFKQFQDLCSEHMNPSEDGKPLLWKDLQGFWDMIKIQIDNVDEMFTEIELMRQNGWKELSIHSRGSSVSSSPKSGSLSLSNTSTPAGTPGSSRKTKVKDTPESSPERTEKMRQAAKARDEARKRLLAERRAAMKQKQQKQAEQDIQIFISEPSQ